jgi:hypothetical protein
MMKKKPHPDIEIVELILVKCGNDYDRTFMGTIKRELDSEGTPVLCGSVIVGEGKIYCCAATEDKLCQDLDEICLMKLDYNLHSSVGVATKILDTDLFLN